MSFQAESRRRRHDLIKAIGFTYIKKHGVVSSRELAEFINNNHLMSSKKEINSGHVGHALKKATHNGRRIFDNVEVSRGVRGWRLQE